MDDRLKQRLVGAAVIVALAAIFIPMILEGPDDGMGPVGSNLPAAPDFEARDRIKPLVLPPPPDPQQGDQSVVLDEPPAGETLPADAAARQQADPEEAPTPTADGTPAADEAVSAPRPEVSGWVVQVGSFSKKSNALGLRDRLRDKGYSTFVERADTGEGTTYRVRVGPELQRDNAERQRESIEQKLGLQGMVTGYP